MKSDKATAFVMAVAFGLIPHVAKATDPCMRRHLQSVGNSILNRPTAAKRYGAADGDPCRSDSPSPGRTRDKTCVLRLVAEMRTHAEDPPARFY